MLRAILLLMILAGGAVFVAPSWDADTRTLTLRVRERDEIGEAVRRGARSLGREFVRLLSDRDETPAVGAGGDKAKAESQPRERLTADDRARLDELVEEKLAED
jgi:hypothetical protein